MSCNKKHKRRSNSKWRILAMSSQVVHKIKKHIGMPRTAWKSSLMNSVQENPCSESVDLSHY